MSTTKKSLLDKIRAIFAEDTTPVAASTATPLAITLQDGTNISVIPTDPAATTATVGDVVSKDGAPVGEGSWIVADGTVITTDATSVITSIIPVAATPDPVTGATSSQTPPAASAAPVIKFSSEKLPTNKEEFIEAMAQFATGTPEEQMANQWIMIKALMQYCFGYDLANQDKANALNTYKQELNNVTVMAAKHEKILPDLFELVEKVVEQPAADPQTLEGANKDKFNARNKREKVLEGAAKAIKDMKEGK